MLAQKKVGILSKVACTGPFIEEWNKVYDDVKSDLEEVDVSPAVSSAALAVKDKDELVRHAYLATLRELIRV